MADNRDSGARRALPGEGTGMSGVVELAEQLAVAVKALEEIAQLAKYLTEPAWTEEGVRLVGAQIYRLATSHRAEGQPA